VQAAKRSLIVNETCAKGPMTAPNLATTSFSLQLLGPFAACVNGGSLPPLRTRKDAWLLGLLVLHHPRPLDRARLAGLLWPDSADATAREPAHEPQEPAARPGRRGTAAAIPQPEHPGTRP
jgi:hypothetical protein